ncbi:UNVERIFIED_CONTAM: hypothetical protein Cloal_0796 [Acetivibrio alkalicellulosi]
MRSREKIFITLVFFMIVLTTPLLNYANPGSIEVSIKAGYNNMVRINSICPFYIELKNNGNDVDGEIQIFVVNGYNSKMVYAIPFDLPSNSNKEFVMNIPIMTASRTYDVKIISSNKTLVDTKYTFNKLLPPESQVIGIMTDDVNKLRSIRNIKLEESVVSYDKTNIAYPIRSIVPPITSEITSATDNFFEVIEIDKDTLPDKAEALSTFDYIIISDYDTSSLSENQNEALEQWIRSGKTLIIGTGPNSRKVYSGLKETLKPYETSSHKRITFDHEFNVFPSSDSDQFESIISTGIIGDGEVFMGNKENPLSISYNRGNGKIIVLTFDPTLDPFTNLNLSKSMWQYVISYGFNSINYYSNYDGNFYHRNDYLISQVPEEHSPPLYFLLVIILLYTLIVGPLLYIFLKHKDKRDYSWFIIPLVSFLFIGIVYVAGFRTRYTTAVLNSFSLINIDSNVGKIDVDSSVGLFNNSRGTMRIESSPTQRMEMFSNRHIHMSYHYDNEDFEDAIITNKVLFSNPMVHEIYNVPMWEAAYLRTNLSTDYQSDVLRSVSLSEDENFIATIKNDTKFNFEDSFIIVGNMFIYVGDIPSGDEQKIEVQLNDPSVKKGFHNFINNLYPDGNRHYSRSRDIDFEQTRRRIALNSAYESFSNMLSSQSIFSKIKIAFVALNFDEIDHGLIVNNKYPKTYNTNVIYTMKEIMFEKGENTTIPEGVIKARLDSTRNEGNAQSFSSGSFIFPHSGEAYFTFDIPKELIVHQFRLYSSINTQHDYNYYNYTMPEDIKDSYELYIRNIETDQWEFVNESILINNTEKYLNSSNQIEIKADVNFDNYHFGYDYLWTPEISVSGVVR